jgi:hypothetical protein
LSSSSPESSKPGMQENVTNFDSLLTMRQWLVKPEKGTFDISGTCLRCVPWNTSLLVFLVLMLFLVLSFKRYYLGQVRAVGKLVGQWPKCHWFESGLDSNHFLSLITINWFAGVLIMGPAAPNKLWCVWA